MIRRGRGYDSLARDWWGGWRFKATRLTEEYSLEQCLEDAGDDADFILARRPNGRVSLLGDNTKLPDAAETVLIRFARKAAAITTAPGTATGSDAVVEPGADSA